MDILFHFFRLADHSFQRKRLVRCHRPHEKDLRVCSFGNWSDDGHRDPTNLNRFILQRSEPETASLDCYTYLISIPTPFHTFTAPAALEIDALMDESREPPHFLAFFAVSEAPFFASSMEIFLAKS